MAVLVASHPWAEPSRGREGTGEHVGHRDMGLLSAPETLVSVRCHVDSDMCLLRKLSTFFFSFCFLARLSKTSGPAGEKERLQASCRVSAVLLVEVLPKKLTASLYCS